MRRDKPDGNSKQLDAAFKSYGASVWLLARPFDRLIGYRGRNILVEYKDPRTAYGRKGLSTSQQAFDATWRGGKVQLVTCVSDVPRALAFIEDSVDQ